MAITDELRHNIEGAEQLYGCECRRLTEIADHIDAAHEEAIQREHETAYDKGYDEGYASADDWCGQHEDAMSEHGWYRVVDADKQPIRFNDDVEWELLGSGETESGYVVGIKIDLIAGRQSCRVKVMRDSDFQTIELMAKNLHHVKPAEPEPTVEDVLCELLDKVDDDRAGQAEIIAEYAARLRLADDGKEQ